jgi:putative FmdB family regulatory protein
MPTYVYFCATCDVEFEAFQSFSDKPLKTHDVCGGDVRKVFLPAGIVFKGSGFYATDSRSSKDD